MIRTPRSGTVTFVGSNVSTISGATTFRTLTINKTNSEVALLGGTTAANLNINSGSALTLAGQALTLTGTFTNAGTLRLLGSETLTGFTNDTANSGTVEYYGNGSYTGLAAGNNYYNLTFSGAGSYTLNASPVVLGNISFSSPYGFFKTITVQASQVVGGPLTDFTMLFSVVDPALMTVANGGKVTASSSAARPPLAFR